MCTPYKVLIGKDINYLLMSVNKTTSFGMTYSANNDDLKSDFDEEFDSNITGPAEAAVPSWGCTGSCICCSNGCDSCF